LVRKQLLDGITGPFDPEFGRTGGSDTVLFARLLDAGALMVWCDEAIVAESVDASRTRLTWLLRRSFRTGQSWFYSQSKAARISRTRQGEWRLVWRSLWSLGYSISASLLLAPISRSRMARNLRSSAWNLGVLSAFFGHRYLEYAP
jgi:succinoglycan biosynthesis protein ExoM